MEYNLLNCCILLLKESFSGAIFRSSLYFFTNFMVLTTFSDFTVTK